MNGRSAGGEERKVFAVVEERRRRNRLRRQGERRCKMRESIFRVGKSYRFSSRPGKDTIIKSVGGDSAVGSTGAKNEPGIYTMIQYFLELRSTCASSMLFKKEEHSSSFGDGIHFRRGEHTPAVPISRGIKRTNIGEADAKSVKENCCCVESSIATCTTADS